MFSIIIPLYNKATYVEKALHSVLTQTYHEFEIIVIDDGSTDNSYEIAKSILRQTTNCKLQTQPNQGVSTARNNGVKLAQYSYICFLDADDWWEPTFLEEMKILIKEFPQAGIYGSSYYKVKNAKNIRANIGVDVGFEKGIINYFQVYAKTMWMPLTSISVVIPKTIFEKENGFKPSLKLGEDFDLWVRIAAKYPVAYLNKTLAYYNQDVDIQSRAVGVKLYEASQHMLFTDYGKLIENEEFRFLFERLSLYGLQPYYLNNKNKQEVKKILHLIRWEKHELKYRLIYKIVPKILVRVYFKVLTYLSSIKKIWRHQIK